MALKNVASLFVFNKYIFLKLFHSFFKVIWKWQTWININKKNVIKMTFYPFELF